MGFEGATDAANMLLASIPAMLSHWEGLQWAPETRDGYAVIESLHDALSRAFPYIEFPFGEHERLTPQKWPKKPKEWHCPGAPDRRDIVVTATALCERGAESPSQIHIGQGRVQGAGPDTGS